MAATNIFLQEFNKYSDYINQLNEASLPECTEDEILKYVEDSIASGEIPEIDRKKVIKSLKFLNFYFVPLGKVFELIVPRIFFQDNIFVAIELSGISTNLASNEQVFKALKSLDRTTANNVLLKYFSAPGYNPIARFSEGEDSFCSFIVESGINIEKVRIWSYDYLLRKAGAAEIHVAIGNGDFTIANQISEYLSNLSLELLKKPVFLFRDCLKDFKMLWCFVLLINSMGLIRPDEIKLINRIIYRETGVRYNKEKTLLQYIIEFTKKHEKPLYDITTDDMRIQKLIKENLISPDFHSYPFDDAPAAISNNNNDIDQPSKETDANKGEPEIEIVDSKKTEFQSLGLPTVFWDLTQAEKQKACEKLYAILTNQRYIEIEREDFLFLLMPDVYQPVSSEQPYINWVGGTQQDMRAFFTSTFDSNILKRKCCYRYKGAEIKLSHNWNKKTQQQYYNKNDSLWDNIIKIIVEIKNQAKKSAE